MHPDVDPVAADRARELARSLTDRQLLEEAGKGPGAMKAEGWAAVSAEMVRRGHHVHPWRNQGYLLMTSMSAVQGFAVSRTLDVLTAEYVVAMHMGKDLAAGITDVVDGRSTATEQALREAKTTAMDELRSQAKALHADAVIGVSFSYSEVSGPAKRLLLVAAMGTAVQLTKHPGAPIHDTAGDVVAAAPAPHVEDGRPERSFFHPPRFPGIVDKSHPLRRDLAD